MVMTQVLHKPPGLRTIPADMPPRANRRGEETRARIMRELRQRQAACEPMPTLSGLARRLGLSPTAVRHQVRILEADGELEVYEPSEGQVAIRLPATE